MIKRPTSVTVISWILIVTGAISVVTSFAMMNNPMAIEIMQRSPIPVSVQQGMLFVGIAISIASGVMMLKGKVMGRSLYVGWSAISFLIGLFTSPIKTALIPGLVVFGLIVFFLFRPKPNEYFASASTFK